MKDAFIVRRGGSGGSGAGGINFDVKAYASENDLPSTAKENSIAILTPDEMTSWIMSPSEPESPAEGMVWVLTGTSSAVGFNAIRKNVIQIYPLSASLYANGDWVDVKAKSFQNGSWVDWWIPGTLFVDGIDDMDLTGGWASFPYSAGSGFGTKTVDVEISSDGVCATLVGTSSNSTYIGTNNMIDVTDYSTIKFEFSEAKRTTASGAIKIALYSDAGYTTAAYTHVIGTEGQLNLSPEIDVSNLSGKYYIGYFMWTWSACTLSAKMTLARLS